MNSKVNYIMLLHAHLPYINHLDSNYVEENWYFENVVESYIPFLRMIERLSNDGINPNITVSLSPTLCYMMENEFIEKKLKNYIERRISLIESEISVNKDERILNILELYHKNAMDALEFINKYSSDIITPFKLYQNQGLVEIITTPATYPIIPLLVNKETIDAQITLSANDYKERFLKKLNGIYLSECAYDERVEVYLNKNSIRYFFVDDFAIDLNKDSKYTHYKTENGISFFVLDYDISKFIIGEDSYLSNPVYREFYKDIGYEKDIDYISKFTLSKERIPTGIKYHRITDINKPIDDKEIYDINMAFKRAESDSVDFLNKISSKINSYKTDPVVVTCFNMEIFGHRWFEGIHFLESFFRNARANRNPVQFITPSIYLGNNSGSPVLNPYLSSSSDNGFFDKWLNEKNDFIYPYVYELTKKYIGIINKFTNSYVNAETDRALKQLTREILLMQSSDWATLITYDTHKDYSIFRIEKHYNNALKIINDLNSGKISVEFIRKLESENFVFNSIDWKNFATKSVF